MLYYLSHATSPFSPWLLRQSLEFCPSQPELQSSYFKLLVIARMTGLYHHTQLLVEMKLFAQSGLKPNPTYLSFPNS
jgi:hypothetical protein